MGGGSYKDDVPGETRTNANDYFSYSRETVLRPVEERKCHPTLDPRGVTRECCDSEEHRETTPIVVFFDLTESRGDDTSVVCQKLPSLVGQTVMNGYVPDPSILFGGIGDATCDRAPLQVAQFEADSRLDAHLRKVWIERGGGGTGQESYELAAYFLARHTKLDAVKRGKKGLVFLLGDEGFYPTVSKQQVKAIIGDKLEEDIPSKKIFQQLQALYNVFFIYPKTSWEQRKEQIDEEIRQRVIAAGGMIDGVDIRFSLIWNNRNDLDIHVITPANTHIYYGSKIAGCGGCLDVDRNVRGEDPKPVENVRWERGKGRRGTYKVYVENYCFHESASKDTPFRVECEVNGKITTFEGEMKAGLNNEKSRVQVGEFYFDPNARQQEAANRYSLYDDKVVKRQWGEVLPPENILLIEKPKACVDIMLGVMALTNGTRTLEGYVKDLQAKGQTSSRIEEVTASLKDLATLCQAPQIVFPKSSGPNPKGKRPAGRRLI